MAAMISRRLGTKFLKPSHTPSLSLSSSTHFITQNPHFSNPSNNFTSSLDQKSIKESSFESSTCPEKPHFSFQSPQIWHQRAVGPKPISPNLSFDRSSPSFGTKLYHHRLNRLSGENPSRFLSSESEKTNEPSPYPSQNPEFKHQEIEGPAVECDLSPLAKVNLQDLEQMMKMMMTICGLIRVMALLGLEPDLSPLGKENLQLLEQIRKKMKIIYVLIRAMALLGLLELGLGGWISYITGSLPMLVASIQNFMTLGFPFALVFMCRQAFKKM